MHPADIHHSPGIPAGPSGQPVLLGFVSYKGDCIDFFRGWNQVCTVSFSVFTPPGWMQWQATQ